MFVFGVILLTFGVKQGTAWMNNSTRWQQNSIIRTNPAIRDKIFPTKLLYESAATSTVDCAFKCVTTERCVFFTFTITLPPVSAPCRGHSSVMEAESTAVFSFGTKAFVFNDESRKYFSLSIYPRN